jgi:dihydropteroate synthase
VNCKVIAPRRPYTIALPTGSLTLGPRCLVMGIINLTPDSFADSRRVSTSEAVDLALEMEQCGVDVIDVGGESTRPGASPVSAAEERARVMPALRAIVGCVRVPLSIDTYKAETAAWALAEGVVMVNDVSGLQHDARLAEVVASTGAALVLTHTRGRSTAMYASASYADVATDVAAELSEAVNRATSAGIARAQLILDPGIGFAKRPEHSYGVLARLDEVATALDRPLLVGPSRKSFMAEALGHCPAEERDWGTAAAVTSAVLSGAHMVRVHAVREMTQVVRVAEEIRRNS